MFERRLFLKIMIKVSTSDAGKWDEAILVSFRFNED